ncbi:VOC family protein [Parvibaculaceae bacterium PLY_AMNH_Bact1]|nr:VOC family protein [Parvibaculaceae bacterium PLY_AMNH_Bact1]
MVRLEHVNLCVAEIEPTLNFLLTAFPDWKVRGSGKNSWYGRDRNWVHVGTEDTYITLNDGARGDNRDLTGDSPGLAHLGFCVEDLEGLALRLRDAGYPIEIIGGDHPFRKNLYFLDPAGFEFDFVEYLSEKPEEKNMYGGETSPVRRLLPA